MISLWIMSMYIFTSFITVVGVGLAILAIDAFASLFFKS